MWSELATDLDYGDDVAADEDNVEMTRTMLVADDDHDAMTTTTLLLMTAMMTRHISV